MGLGSNFLLMVLSPQLDFKHLLVRTFALFLRICPALSVCLAVYEDMSMTQNPNTC